jgi:hypothetical protein
MADSFGKNWIDKSHERIERMQDASNEEDTENQRLLDEEEIEYGHVDDRTDEMEDYRKLRIFFSLMFWKIWTGLGRY